MHREANGDRAERERAGGRGGGWVDGTPKGNCDMTIKLFSIR